MRKVVAGFAWMFRTLPLPISIFVVLALIGGVLVPVALVVDAIQVTRILSANGISRADYNRTVEPLNVPWPDAKAIIEAAKNGNASLEEVVGEWKRLGLDREELAELSAAAAKDKVGLLELTSSFDTLMDFPRFTAASEKGISFHDFQLCKSNWRKCASDYAVIEIYLGAAGISVSETCRQAAEEAASYADPRVPFTAFVLPPASDTERDFSSSGQIRIADTVSFQNGFGVYQDVRVTCVVDLATRSAFVEAL